MSARRSVYTLERRNTVTGAVVVREDLSARDVRQAVAWCANDNLGMTRREATALADGITPGGEPYWVGHYAFVTTVQ